MRLIALELRSFRSFRGGPYRVAFDERATRLVGPNEAGKSTLFEAIRRALFDRARTQAKWVKRVQPAGLEGAEPWVRLEFEHGGRVMRVEKAFGPRGDCTLSEQKGGDEWIELARKEPAEEELLRRLGAEVLGRADATRPSTWGAFQWLFVSQESRRLPAPEDDAVSHLGLESAGVSEHFDLVHARVDEEHSRVFTRTGLVAKSSALHEAEWEVGDLRARREEAEEAYEEAERLRRRYDDALARQPELDAAAAGAKRELDRLDEKVGELSSAESAHRAAQERLRRADVESRQAMQVQDERRRRENDAGAARTATKQAVDEHARADERQKRAYDRFEEGRRELLGLEQQVEEIRAAERKASRTLREAEARDRLDEAERRLTRAEEVDLRLSEPSPVAGEGPSRELVREVDRLAADAEANRRAYLRSALAVTKEGAVDAEIEIDGQPTEATSAHASHRVVIRPRGGGRIVVESGSEDAASLAARVARADVRIRELIAPHGAADPEELREMTERREIALRSRTALEAERQAIDERPTEVMRAEVDELRTQWRRLASDPSGSTILDVEDVAVARGAFDAVERELTRARQDLTRRRDEIRAASEALERARAEHGDASRALTVAEAAERTAATELDRHRERHGSTEQVSIHATETAAERDASRGAERTARDALDALRRSARQEREAAKAEFDRRAEIAHREAARLAQWKETLEDLASRGVYSAFAEVDRMLEAESERVVELKRRAAGIALLKASMDEIRARAVRQVVDPIRRELDDLLGFVTGGRYTLATLGSSLRPETLEGEHSVLVEEDGSEGLKELVATLVRVCVAAHLGRNERQALILDDPCVHVSRERTARLVERLNLLVGEGRVQLVVLTHRGEEFAGLLGREIDVRRIERS